jgi:thymidine kinase
MFSGKTEELIRRIRRFQFANKKVLVCKHSLDDRYEKKYLNSHQGDKLRTEIITSETELLSLIKPDTNIIAIDEIQFFDNDIIPLIMELRDRGIKILASGLDLDFRGLPFGPMPYLLALADEVIKLKAICFKTGQDAQYSQRLINGNPAKHSDETVLIGAVECYEARTRKAFQIDYVPIKEYLKKNSSQC